MSLLARERQGGGKEAGGGGGQNLTRRPPTENNFRPPSPRYVLPPPPLIIPFLLARSLRSSKSPVFASADLLRNSFRRVSKNGFRRAILARFFRSFFKGGVTEGGGFHTRVRGTMFACDGAVTPGPSCKCDITFFVKGRPKSARQSRDSTVAARSVQSVTVPSSRVSRECRSPGLRPPLLKNARVLLFGTFPPPPFSSAVLERDQACTLVALCQMSPRSTLPPWSLWCKALRNAQRSRRSRRR